MAIENVACLWSKIMSNQTAASERLSHRESTSSKLPDAGQSSFPSSEGSQSLSQSGSLSPEGTESLSEEAKRVAADTAAAMTGDLKQFFNEQLRSGAKMGNHFASSLRLSASALPPDASMLAGMMRGVAHQVDGYATELGRQSVDQVAAGASNFIRRQPALVFGLAAAAGFLAFRTFKSAQSVTAPSIQPTDRPSGPTHD
jgi:hypothetical protein